MKKRIVWCNLRIQYSLKKKYTTGVPITFIILLFLLIVCWCDHFVSIAISIILVTFHLNLALLLIKKTWMTICFKNIFWMFYLFYKWYRESVHRGLKSGILTFSFSPVLNLVQKERKCSKKINSWHFAYSLLHIKHF